MNPNCDDTSSLARFRRLSVSAKHYKIPKSEEKFRANESCIYSDQWLSLMRTRRKKKKANRIAVLTSEIESQSTSPTQV